MAQGPEYGAAQPLLGPAMDFKRKARNLYDRLSQPISPRYTPMQANRVDQANEAFRQQAAAEDAKKAAARAPVKRAPARTPVRTPARPAARR
jgi:hypothetical protein